jgi:hypothetical protein
MDTALALGLNINQVSTEGFTPLYYAYRHDKLIPMFLARGAVVHNSETHHKVIWRSLQVNAIEGLIAHGLNVLTLDSGGIWSHSRCI